ncbi:CocE/NonD family hydrolase [Dactylosporangium sp. CA-092794]|uniref:CocE/NonD family hydrolase n=1 Tax=Dactylosporangium sp. CA-092794 TaxID=3239929 RepID=UPI003D8BD96E
MTAADTIDDELRAAAEHAMGGLGEHNVLHETAEVSTRDGTALSTDVFHPAGAERGPAILMRTPYGRGNWHNDGVYWASHGYRLVLQDCRGTSSYFAEAGDGADTAAWIERAPWFDGSLFLHGASYLGFTAWATASNRPASLRAMSVQIYSADRVSSWYPGGTFGLDIALPWSASQASAEDKPERRALTAASPTEGIDAAFNHLPLQEADVALGGAVIPFYRERLRYGGDDPHWAPLNFSDLLSGLDVPVLLIDGWYDYHRRYMWQDYQTLRSRPHADTRLVMGPWFHIGTDPHVVNEETRRWFDRHRHAVPADAKLSVRLYVTPDRGWVEAPGWPPAGSTSTTLYLSAGRAAASVADADAAADTYTYDPGDPTPSVGISSFGGPDAALPTDNRALEARPDVLVYTAEAFDQAVTIVGAVRARLFVNSTEPTADFFVRITDVHPDGTSMNVVDGITRIPHTPRLAGDEPVEIEVDLGPVAHRIDAGHAIRIQVSSGAHPMYARNPGGTESPATTMRLFPATQTVHLGGDRASRVLLDLYTEENP